MGSEMCIRDSVSRFTCDPLPDLGSRPVVFVANHTSFSDVFYAVAVLSDWRYPARCLVRYSYFRPAIVGRWLRTLLCVPAGGGGTAAAATQSATSVFGISSRPGV